MKKTYRSVLIFMFLCFACFPGGKLGKRHRVLPGRLILKPDLIRLCPNVSQPVEITSYEIKRSGSNGFVMNCDFRATRTIHWLTKSTVRIENCAHNDPESCRHFSTFPWHNDTCYQMERKNAYWSPIFQSIMPELLCPIKAGNYFMRNGTLDLKLLGEFPFPLERYYWRSRVEAFYGGLVLCVDLGTRIIRVRP